MQENEKKLYELLSRVLEYPVSKINDQTSPKEVPSWDSYNILMIVSELEQVFGVVFTIQDVGQSFNVGDIKKVLRKYNINL